MPKMKYKKKTNFKISLFPILLAFVSKAYFIKFENKILINFQMNIFSVLPTQLGHENKVSFFYILKGF